jgi:hypothetical protein
MQYLILLRGAKMTNAKEKKVYLLLAGWNPYKQTGLHNRITWLPGPTVEMECWQLWTQHHKFRNLDETYNFVIWYKNGTL